MTYRQLLAAVREAERRESEAACAREAAYFPRHNRQPDFDTQVELENAASAADDSLDEEINFT